MRSEKWARMGQACVPAGLSAGRELKWIASGWALSLLWSLNFVLRYLPHREKLFDWVGGKRVLMPGAVMTDFCELMPGLMAGFGVVAACMAVLAVYHYFYHYQGSRSIDLMRRLPNRWELWRRCLALPAAAALASGLLALVLTAVYYAVYALCTPAACLTPGQLSKLIAVMMGA